MSGRTDWKEIFGKPDQGFVNRVHATLEGLTEAGTSRCTPQHFRRRRLLTLTAVLVLLAGAALAAAEYGVLDFLLGIHEQPQRREVLEPLVTPVNAEAEAGTVSLEISGVWTDGEMLAMDWRIQNREPQTPVYVQIDQWTLNGICVGSDGSDSFDCQWLPGLYAPDGVMQDGEVIALPGEVKGGNDLQMELAVGVYTPIDPVYAMDSFDPEEARRKTEQGYFVIAGGEGLTAQEGDAWYQCFGRIDAALDPALAARFKRQELRISLSLDMTCANACREPLTVRERYTCDRLMARYESAVLTPLGLYVQLVAEPAEGTREAAEALPHRELLCGFVSGADELRGWDRGELFGFYHDTRPVLGRLEDIIPLPRSGDAERAAHTGACGIYHACSHNYLHERSVEVLSSLLKTSRFVLRACCFCETGRYFSSLAELADQLSGTDRAVLALSMDPGTAAGDFEGCSRLLLDWARELIGSGEQ